MLALRLPQFLSHKPAWLYEPLPFLYIAAGVAVFLELESGFAGLSGSLFILAGASILLMRHNHRRAIPAKARNNSRRR